MGEIIQLPKAKSVQPEQPVKENEPRRVSQKPVILTPVSYTHLLEFVAAEYYCDQCRWMAESKRSGQLPEDRKYWEH